jgi:hypothetical protein
MRSAIARPLTGSSCRATTGADRHQPARCGKVATGEWVVAAECAATTRRPGSVAALAGTRAVDSPDPVDLRAQARSSARRAVERQLAVDRAQAVGEPAQTRALCCVGAADPVVGDLDDHAAVHTPDRDPGLGRARILRDVCEPLRDHEVGGALDRAGQATLAVRLERHGHRRTRYQRLQRRLQPAISEDGGVDAARQLGSQGCSMSRCRRSANAGWRARYAYLCVNAKVQKVRDGGRVARKCVVIPHTVHETGRREIIGLDVGAAEPRRSGASSCARSSRAAWSAWRSQTRIRA